MKIIKVIKQNVLLFSVVLIYLVLIVTMPDKAIKSGQNTLYYIIEMFEIMPVIFILTSLIEAWVPREVITSSFGQQSGLKGSLLSFILGSFSAGPIYAAFPVCKMLIKKGASIFNIVIILSTWAVIKAPMLANEAKFLGLKFMGVRWILTTVAIFIMGYIVSLFIKNDDIPNDEELNNKNNELIYIKEQYCIGCGLCTKTCPDYFEMIDKKAKIKKQNINLKSYKELIEIAKRCPARAIYVSNNSKEVKLD